MNNKADVSSQMWPRLFLIPEPGQARSQNET